MNNTQLERLAYSVEEFCRATSIGRTIAFRLIKEGRLEAKKIGGRTLITVASARRLFAEAPDARDVA